ncbi:hypothetical protein JWV26_06445 [Ectopseudomonas toyotomiensis]|uniref:Uncharacterized protein n=1 Tax=Ectopseudomonas toyotomiensis TaxID=554344 RepID=A0ABD7DZR3_9GAMM|nr:hypothetical protein [Pseudomonas toyotomiensis]QSL93994.1 hypothetical protein JWV26_06445 [Pseudomonas toyotomiensis]
MTDTMAQDCIRATEVSFAVSLSMFAITAQGFDNRQVLFIAVSESS